jgi:SPP1 gp7 family putative phage head morphogenesis protein
MAEIKGNVSPESINIATRGQVLLERMKSGQAAKFAPFLKQMEVILRMRLAAGDLTGYQARRVAVLLDAIETDLRAVLGEYRTALTGDLVDTAIQQAQFEAKSLDTVVTTPAFESIIPAAAQVRAAVLSAPLSVVGYNQGQLLESWLKNWSEGQIEQISGVIRQGYYQGQTTEQIVRALRGTTKANFQDGTLAQIDRSNRTVVRTSVQHMSTVARQQTYEANSDLITGVQWVSTLDSRTTSQCRALSGRRFPIDKGPRPPLHPACRSTTVPVLDDAFDILDKGATQSSKGAEGGQQVAADLSYYEWLKTQPAGFQDAAIGPARGKLLRSGGLSADRFAQLQLGQNFQPLTLERMRELEPLAFKRAGI